MLASTFTERAESSRLHIHYFATLGLIRIILITTNTDVVVPAVANAQKIPATEIWVPFSVRKNFSYIPAHEIASQLGTGPASVLPMFHVFMGCETVFFFVGKGEDRALTVWQVSPEAT